MFHVFFFNCLLFLEDTVMATGRQSGRYVRPICLYFFRIDISSRDVALKDGRPF